MPLRAALLCRAALRRSGAGSAVRNHDPAQLLADVPSGCARHVARTGSDGVHRDTDADAARISFALEGVRGLAAQGAGVLGGCVFLFSHLGSSLLSCDSP